MTAIPETGKTLREPDDKMRRPDRMHPVKVAPFEGVVTVRFNEVEIGRTKAALALNEADFRTIFYLPRGDLDMTALSRSDRVTFCPYKGDAVHYTLTAGGEVAESAAWSYEKPYPTLAEIGGYVAFYPNRVSVVSDPPVDE